MAGAAKLAADFRKRFVCPNDLAGRCQRNNRRQRRVGYRGLYFTTADLNILHQVLHLTFSLGFLTQRSKPEYAADRYARGAIPQRKI